MTELSPVRIAAPDETPVEVVKGSLRADDGRDDLVFRKPEWCTEEQWALIRQRMDGWHDGYLAADADLKTARSSGYDDGHVDGQSAVIELVSDRSPLARTAFLIAEQIRNRPPLTIDQLGELAKVIGCNASDLDPSNDVVTS